MLSVLQNLPPIATSSLWQLFNCIIYNKGLSAWGSNRADGCTFTAEQIGCPIPLCGSMLPRLLWDTNPSLSWHRGGAVLQIHTLHYWAATSTMLPQILLLAPCFSSDCMPKSTYFLKWQLELPTLMPSIFPVVISSLDAACSFVGPFLFPCCDCVVILIPPETVQLWHKRGVAACWCHAPRNFWSCSTICTVSCITFTSVVDLKCKSWGA